MAAVGRRMTRAARFAVVASTLVATLLAAAACGSDSTASGSVGSAKTEPVVADAAFPVALLPDGQGGFLYGERLTGQVRHVSSDGALDQAAVATVDTRGADDDQRGLLGLAESGDGRLYAAWTRTTDGRLVVGRIAGGQEETDPADPVLVWVGPPSSQLANGGHLAFGPDGRLVIGIGDLQADHALGDDPTVANRKILSLDPAGPSDQQPTILSSGSNNPFAFTFTPDGTLWVADNTGGDGPERIGRGDRPASDALALGTEGDGDIAPSVLVALDDTRLGVCGFLSGRMQLVAIVDGAPTAPGPELADQCSTGGARLDDGRIVVAGPTEIRRRRTGRLLTVPPDAGTRRTSRQGVGVEPQVMNEVHA